MPIKHYTQDEMWKVYETLPEKLKQAVFSAENAEHTLSICERHEIDECSQVASLIGLVLMGVMPPQDLQGALVQDLKLKEAIAQRVVGEINRFVFYPVKAELENLHKTVGEEKTTSKIDIPTPRHEDTYVGGEYMPQEEKQEEPVKEKPRGSKTKTPKKAKKGPYQEEDVKFEEDEEGIEQEPAPKKQDTYREPIK